MSRPLRFLQVTTFYPPYAFGGDAVFVQRLAHALADRGHEVHVVHDVDAYRMLHPDPPDRAAAPHPGVTCHPLRSPLGRLSPLVAHQTGAPLPHLGRLRRLIDEVRPDVVHYHNISLFGPRVLALAGRSGHRAVKLFTTHEHWLVCPTHVLWKHGERPCERPACLGCTLRARRPPQLWRSMGLLRRALGHVDRLLSPSRFSIAMHRERGLDAPFVHFPSFADPPGPEPGGPAPHPRPYFLYVGRLEPIKGVGALISAWKRVEGHDLLIAGSGGEEARLRTLAEGDSRIRFLGAQDRAALGRLYAHAIAVVVPSVGYEVFPLVVPEALALGTPVLARALGGLTEMIEDSGGGLLFSDGDGLVGAVHRLGGDPELRARLATDGHHTFAERWSTDAHLARYLELIEAVAAERFGHVPWRDSSRSGAVPAAAGEA